MKYLFLLLTACSTPQVKEESIILWYDSLVYNCYEFEGGVSCVKREEQDEY